MPAPPITLVHLKTSRQQAQFGIIDRYWFEWQNRKNNGAIVLRIEFLDAAGNVVVESSVKLPKVKIKSFIPATETEPQKPVYDSSVWIQIDDVVREVMPVSFRYYTLTGLFSKSESVTSELVGKFEDISQHG